MAKKGVLVDKAGRVVQVGDTLVSFRGEKAVVTDWQQGSHSGSTGRVYVKWNGDSAEMGYYPSVFDCEIIRED